MKEALVLLDNKYRIISFNPAAKEVFCVGEDGADGGTKSYVCCVPV